MKEEEEGVHKKELLELKTAAYSKKLKTETGKSNLANIVLFIT